MPVDPAPPVVTAACFFCCRRAMGEALNRHSLPPLRFSEGRATCTTRARSRRGTRSAATRLFDIRIRVSSMARRVADLAGDDVAEQFPGLAVELHELHLLDREIVIRRGVDLDAGQHQVGVK